jgi:Flp pilus assembly protein protease CpaA
MSIAEAAQSLVIGLFSILLLVASISDVMVRRIPNWTVLTICMLAVPWILLAPNATLLSSGEAILVAFAVGWPLYMGGAIGAGDSKLLMAVALIVGVSKLLVFFMIVGLAGGLIAAVSLLRQPTRALVMFQTPGKGNVGPGVPYGVAISIGAAAVTTWPLARRLVG